MYFSNTSSSGISRIKSKFTFAPKGEDDTHTKKINANVFRSISRNTIICVEGKGDGLIDLLFCFPNFLVGVVKFLGKRSTFSHVHNLYASVVNLSTNVGYTKSERCKSTLLDLKLAKYFGCNSLPLSVDEISSFEINFSGCVCCKHGQWASTDYEHGIIHAYYVKLILN